MPKPKNLGRELVPPWRVQIQNPCKPAFYRRLQGSAGCMAVLVWYLAPFLYVVGGGGCVGYVGDIH